MNKEIRKVLQTCSKGNSTSRNIRVIKNAEMSVLTHATLVYSWEGVEVDRSERERDSAVPLGDRFHLCRQQLFP